LGVLPEQLPSLQHCWHAPPQLFGLLAGQAQRPFWHVAPPQQEPPIPAPQRFPMGMHVAQQRVSSPHPLLFTRPSGMVVRQ
jgi:hypothetical protein